MKLKVGMPVPTLNIQNNSVTAQTVKTGANLITRYSLPKINDVCKHSQEIIVDAVDDTRFLNAFFAAE